MKDELKALPLFAGLKDSDLEELLAAPHRRRVYKPGKTIMSAGDAVQSLVVLAAGRVETRMGGDEREVVIDRLAAPCLLAPAFLFASDNTLPVDAVAVEECVVWMLNHEGFVRFMAAHSEVMCRFLRTMSDRSRFLSEKVFLFTATLSKEPLALSSHSPSKASAGVPRELDERAKAGELDEPTASSTTCTPTAPSSRWPPPPSASASPAPPSAASSPRW